MSMFHMPYWCCCLLLFDTARVRTMATSCGHSHKILKRIN
jgi:hypothetical protein